MKDAVKMAGALALAMIVLNIAKNVLPIPANIKALIS